MFCHIWPCPRGTVCHIWPCPSGTVCHIWPYVHVEPFVIFGHMSTWNCHVTFSGRFLGYQVLLILFSLVPSYVSPVFLNLFFSTRAPSDLAFYVPPNLITGERVSRLQYTSFVNGWYILMYTCKQMVCSCLYL